MPAAGEARNSTRGATSSKSTFRPRVRGGHGVEPLVEVGDHLAQRIGRQRARGHDVRADPARRELDRQIADERLGERLRRADADVVRDRDVAAAAREEEHGAAAVEQRERRLHEVEQRQLVEVRGLGS
jgi:hypothetical protein